MTTTAEDELAQDLRTYLPRIVGSDIPAADYNTIARWVVGYYGDRLLPPAGEERTEWGVWWHAGNPDGICMDHGGLGSREEAIRVGLSRLDMLGISGFTVVSRVHRRYEIGNWSEHWRPDSERV